MKTNNRLLQEPKYGSIFWLKILPLSAAALISLFHVSTASSRGFSSKEDLKKFQDSKGAVRSDLECAQHPRKGSNASREFRGKIPLRRKNLSQEGKTEQISRIKSVNIISGNLHSRPTKRSAIVEKLQMGDKVILIEKRDEWYIVKLQDDRLGWAHQSLFLCESGVSEPARAPLEKGEFKIALHVPVIDDNRLYTRVKAGRVREKPSLDSKIIYRLKKGDMVSVIETRDEWHRIEFEDSRLGWAHKSLFFKSNQNQLGSEGVFKEIKEIGFRIISDSEEKVMFLLNGRFSPHIFGLEKNSPRVVCDFSGTRLASHIGYDISTNGNLVERIRIGIYKVPDSKVRVVLDLVPHQHNDYEIHQMFVEAENVYTLIIKRVQKEKKKSTLKGL